MKIISSMYVLLILIELKCLMVSKRAYWIKLILINSNSFFDSLLWIPKSVFVFLSVYIKIKPCFKQIKTLKLFSPSECCFILKYDVDITLYCNYECYMLLFSILLELYCNIRLLFIYFLS